MKASAVICNIVYFAFLCLVLVTDGLPNKVFYIFFTLWALLTPILTVLVIVRYVASTSWLSFGMRKASMEQMGANILSPAGTIWRIAAILCNIVHLASSCWALIDQYPHPAEEGFVAFLIIMFLTPILSLAVIAPACFRGFSAKGQPLAKPR